ncbi:MAG: hypothetical protein WHT08_18520, partial [Bryobacteraceae bacterium]
ATIPVYRADGRLYDVVTERALARLQAAGLIARVVRHRKGHINRAIMIARTGEAPLPRTAYLGTRYSFQDHLEHGLCWDLKRLGGDRWGTNYAPEEVRPLFLQVVTGCLVER